MTKDALVPPESIAMAIGIIRGQKVILDVDLAALYGVKTKRLNEQVRRNIQRFPADFMFQLSAAEAANLKSQFATSSSGHGGRRKRPFAFTEHGALMAATVLNSSRAVEVGLFVVRTFVRLRETVRQHKGLAAKLDELEKQTKGLALKQNALEASTSSQLKQAFDAIRQLMSPMEPTKRKQIGFVTESKKRGM